MGLDLLFRQLAFREEIGERNEHKDEKRDANIEKRERHRGQVEEQRVEILELDAAMVVDHVRVVTMVLNNRRAQQGEGQRAQRQYNSVESYGGGITRMVAHESGHEGDERHPEQERVVRPEQASIGAASGVQHVMMIHPHDGDDEKAQEIAEKLRENAAQRDERSVARNPELQHHDGDDDGDDAVTESFEAVGTDAVHGYQNRVYQTVLSEYVYQIRGGFTTGHRA